ncbi:MAG: D-aminoacylase [Chloroflexi bacterium]|nr:D-aminoacylase [Chloroflexota bacterium]
MLDVLIKGGQVFDGCGNPGYYAAVGVEGDRVSILRGDVSSVQAKRVIDATGKAVSPGFIDIHAHSALAILDDPKHEPKVHQGVTTELIGIDGNSYAPFKSEKDYQSFFRLNAGIEGDPDVKANWSNVSDYLAMYDKKVSVNIAYIVGNSPLRISTVGWAQKKAERKHIGEMRAMLRESMEDGAMGLSTGLDYPPGRFADTDELVALNEEVAKLGGIYHTHVRYWYGDKFLDPYKEAIEIGRRSGVPVHLTHVFRRVVNSGGARRIFELIEGARDEGLDVTFDCFPYAYGGTRVLIVFPEWAQDGGPDKLMEVLKSKEARERLRKDVVPRGLSWGDMWLTYFKLPQNKQYEGKTIAEMALMRSQHPVDALCDLLVEENLRMSYFGAVIDPGTLQDFITHPLFMVGSDALLLGDFPPHMAYGCYPHILSEVVREERKLSLPEALRRMTSYPAQRMGIKDRGVLRDGMKADIVVFDPKTIRANVTLQNTRARSTGVEYVLVNGQVVMEKDKHTGALPGRAVKHGQS